jgi:peptidoglycan/LPS O-acetylase OafA/YrhL
LRAYAVFLWRRLARIYPVHVAMLAALFVMVAVRGLLNTNFWDVSDLPRHLLLLQAWTDTLTWNLPAWSISAEWAAYVLFPAFVAMILRPASIVPAALVAGALLIGLQLFGLSKGIAWAFMGWPALFRVMSEFALGVLGFRLMRGVAPSLKFDMLAGGALIACLAIPFDIGKVIAIGIFVPAVAASAGPARELLGSRPLVALGIISYSIYMVHFLLFKLDQNFTHWMGLEHPSALVGVTLTLGSCAVVTAAAAGVYWTVERPARNWCRAQETWIIPHAKQHSAAAK